MVITASSTVSQFVGTGTVTFDVTGLVGFDVVGPAIWLASAAPTATLR